MAKIKISTVPFQGTAVEEATLRSKLKELKSVKGGLMPALQFAQGLYGYLPIEVQSIIAEELGISLEEVFGVSTFYAQFSLTPKGKYEVGVCLGTACYVKGAGDVLDRFKKALGIDAGGLTPDGKFNLVATRCIGCCGLAPVLTVGGKVYGKVKPDDVEKILKEY